MDIHAGGNLRCRRYQGSMPAGAEVSLLKGYILSHTSMTVHELDEAVGHVRCGKGVSALSAFCGLQPI